MHGLRGLIDQLLLFPGRETGVDRLIRIGANLQHGAMVVREVSIFVKTVSCHKFDDLQSASGTADVGDFNIRFLLLVEAGDVLE